MASRRPAKKHDGDVVRLPQISKSQSAPQLRKPQGHKAAAQPEASSQPAARHAAKSHPVVLTHDAKREVLEALSDPHIKTVAIDLYKKFDGNTDGLLGLDELCRALGALTKKLRMPTISKEMADTMLKRFDVNGDGSLSADDFYELFVTALRRVAFDQSNLFGRNVFVTQQSGKVWDTYKNVKKLGSGSFATTFLCKQRRTGDERVVKAVEKSKMKLPIKEVENEIMIMRQIDHPHVVRLYEWYEGSSTVYLVIDALHGGTLREVVLETYYKKGSGLKEEWIQQVMGQVVEAMAYCHSLRLIHKDIKDENIVLLKKEQNYDKPFAVIIDLGISEMFSSTDSQGKFVGGTPATMAPEVWTGNFGPKCDVWSVGCVLFELLAGSMPFIAMSMDPRDWNRKYQQGPNWQLVKTSELGKDLCEKMLVVSDSKRLSMKQCLEHEWFSCHRRTLQKVVGAAQFDELKRFCDMSALSRSMLVELAGRLPMDRAEKIVQVFKSFDDDRDGRVSRDELSRGFTKLGMKDQGLLDNMFKALDVDENGSLSFSEFAGMVLLMFKDLLERRFLALFKKFDKDSDGMMNKEDVEALLTVSRKMTKKEASSKEVIAQLFTGNTVKVSYEELRQAVLPGYK